MWRNSCSPEIMRRFHDGIKAPDTAHGQNVSANPVQTVKQTRWTVVVLVVIYQNICHAPSHWPERKRSAIFWHSVKQWSRSRSIKLFQNLSIQCFRLELKSGLMPAAMGNVVRGEIRERLPSLLLHAVREVLLQITRSTNTNVVFTGV